MRPRPATPAPDRPASTLEAAASDGSEPAARRQEPVPPTRDAAAPLPGPATPLPGPVVPFAEPAAPAVMPRQGTARDPSTLEAAPAPAAVATLTHEAQVRTAAIAASAPFDAGASAGPAIPLRDDEPPRPTCTVAQLRRFIKSRPWIPMHELRRRFGVSGGDDDVSPIRVGDHTLYIGLPPAESRLMAELLAGGDVGYELSLDPVTPIVVGVYPMRPVPRG